MALVDIDTDRWVLCEAGDGGEGRSDRSDPPAQPSDGSGQGNVGPAEQVGGNFQALGRLSHGHALLNRIEQVWQSGGKEVRQQAERPMPLGTIPSRDAQPLASAVDSCRDGQTSIHPTGAVDKSAIWLRATPDS